MLCKQKQRLKEKSVHIHYPEAFERQGSKSAGRHCPGGGREEAAVSSEPAPEPGTGPLPGVRAEAVTFRRRCGQRIGLHAVQGSSQLLCESMFLEKP